MKRISPALALIFTILFIHAVRAADCGNPSPDAVIRLPAPLDQWGQLTCTPYGYVIEAHQGWIWSRPGGYSPVWVPAQMVRQNPALLGSQSYFTKIELVKIEADELQIPYDAFQSIFRGDRPPPIAYRLDVTSNSGKSLRLYFLQYETGPWGIWCAEGKCDPTSLFMVLDMTKKLPNQLNNSN
ncbi:MAG: hypothetical protein ABSC26_03490 [Stellaceae bacterium]